jgi:hypothetical protein
MNRRNKQITIYFLLFGLLLIGVVYAILQTNLQINGTTKITQNSWNIHFENIQVNPNSVPIGQNDSGATIDPNNDCKIDFSVTLSIPGDFYEFTVDVVNDGTIDGMVSLLGKSLKVNNVEVQEVPYYLNYDVTYDDGTEILPNHLLAVNSIETYLVRLEYKRDIDHLPEETPTISTSLNPQFIQSDESRVIIPGHPMIQATNKNDKTAFRSDTYRERIKNIILDDEINPPANYLESWDISIAQNGSVMAYLTTNTTDNTMYDLYIQGDGHLYANPDSYYLFYGLKGLDAINNMDALNTSKVTSMNSMFEDTGYNSSSFTLDLGNHFDTSNVKGMN